MRDDGGRADIAPPPHLPTRAREATSRAASPAKTIALLVTFITGIGLGGVIGLAGAGWAGAGWAPPWLTALVNEAADGAKALAITVIGLPPDHGDWAKMDDATRRLVAHAYGYDGPIRDGLFARHLETLGLMDDFKRRHLPDAAPTPQPSSPRPPAPTPALVPPPVPTPVPTPIKESARVPDHGDWTKMDDATRAAIAHAYGYDGPIRDGLFARHLEANGLMDDFKRRYLPGAAPTPAPPPVPTPIKESARVPDHGDWTKMDDATRAAIAHANGYDGPIRDGLFARHLEANGLMDDFKRRYLPDAAPPPRQSTPQPSSPRPPAPTPAPTPVPTPVPTPIKESARVPDHGDWTKMDDATRAAIAHANGYDGPIRDGLFARHLEANGLMDDFKRRYLPEAASTPQPSASRSSSPRPPTPTPTTPAPTTPAPIKTATPARTGADIIAPKPKPTVPPPSAQAPSAQSPSVQSPSVQAPPTREGRRHHVQLGSYQDPGNAARMLTDLKRWGFDGHVIDWTDGRGRLWHVVRVGPLANVTEARRVSATLATRGVKGQVITTDQ